MQIPTHFFTGPAATGSGHNPPTHLSLAGLQAQVAELNGRLEAAIGEIAYLQASPLPWTLAIDGQYLRFEKSLSFEEARAWAGVLAAQFPRNKIQVVTA